ncbi:MAG: SDR family oxidoreductase [Clostridia bacterium]|nr:SDR family oxidoreductase [Clostridia bacterium]
MKLDLSGKRALVTGSSQGIGKEIAKMLSDCGARVYVHGSHMSEKLKAAAEYTKTDKIAVCDLIDENCADILFEQTGAVDILILNASVQFKHEWDKFSMEEYDIQLSCNVKSTYFMIKKYAQPMKETGFGRIITIGSVNEYNNHPELLIYGITKAAQMKMVEGIAKQLAKYGVTVNNIAPGAIETPRNDKALSDNEFRQKVVDSIPIGYVGAPNDMNGAVKLLCSDEGRYITGAEIIADGGMRL